MGPWLSLSYVKHDLVSSSAKAGATQNSAMAARIHRSGPFVEFSRAEVEGSIPARFERQVDQHADRVAVRTQRSELTYDDLNRAANRLASALLSTRGARPEQVAVLFERDAGMIAAALGVLKAGKALVPLDASYPQARNSYILRQSRAALLVTNDQCAPLARDLLGDETLVLNVDEFSSRVPDGNIELSVAPDSVACILYTSGSTGRPLGVVHDHRTLLHFIRRYTNALGVCSEDRLSQLSSCGHIAGLSDVLRGLLNGAAVLPLDPRECGPAELARWLSREEITICHLVPTLFRHLTAEVAGERCYPHLRLIHLGGEPASPHDVELYRQHFPASCVLLNNLGCTEVSSFRQYLIDHETVFPLDAVPVGYPVEDTEVLLLDEAGKEVPAGEEGQIAVKSRYMALGYWGERGITTTGFSTLPGPLGERLYRTGDLGRFLPDGCLLYLGRKDFQVQIRGYRVETAEVERILLESGKIAACAVIGMEDPAGEVRLVAYLVADKGQTPSIAELRKLLQERLPAYMVPGVFAWLDGLPLLPHGKIDRRALPQPDWTTPGRDRAFLAPRTSIEARVAAIWAEVLGVETVGVEDHFLELGGNSLKATQVMARLRSTLGVALPQRTLFEEPSLAAFASRVEIGQQSAQSESRTAPIVRVASDRPGPLSYAQLRMWFFNQLEPDSPLYNLPFGPLGMSSRPCASRWIGPLKLGALELSLGEIVRRHEVLRTRFPYTSAGVVQEILPATQFHLRVEDLTGLAADDRQRSASERVLAETHRPFNLTEEPPFRAILLQLAADEYVLVAVIHHIAYDRWSRGILLRELAVLYSAYVAGEVSPLGEPALQYRDYAYWQWEQLEGEALKPQLAYWRQRLRSAPNLLELPSDRPRPTLPSHRGDCWVLPLSGELVQRLELLARSERASLMMVLVAGLQAQLSAYSGQTDVSVGIVVAGRTRLELEDVVGCCTNTLVLCTDLSGDLTFGDLLRRVRTETLGAYAHQEVPFEKLVEELRPRRNPGYHPFFQVLFNYLEVPRRTAEIPGVRIEDFDVSLGTALVDLSVDVERTEVGTTCYFSYSVDLFDRARIADWVKDYEALLQAAVSYPERPLSTLMPRGNPIEGAGPEDLLSELEQMSEEEAERALGEASAQTAKAPPDRGSE